MPSRRAASKGTRTKAGVAPTDADVAELYDVLNPWNPARFPADAFYHERVMGARDVLDVGCGTGSMLHHARVSGHAGRLVGVDPDSAALDRARRRSDVEWVLARAAEMTWDRQFDLATMASHAFQCLIDDDEVRSSLAAIRAALRTGGLFAFETRHPQARVWEEWSPANTSDVTAPSGRTFRMWHTVESVVGDVVTLVETFANEEGNALRVDRGQLRFLDVRNLNRFLTDSGLSIAGQYGDWQRGPITDASREIVTVTRRA